MTLASRRNMIIALVAVVAIAVAALALSGPISSAVTDNDQPITGEAYDKAVEAALAHTGEGHVTETEQGDEDSYYEVEVTLDDGTQVDVQLDRDFNVVGQNPDDDSNEDDDSDD